MTTLTADQHRAVAEPRGEPLRLIDPVTNRAYVLLAEDAYDRVKSLAYDDSPWSDEEMDLLAGEDADILGWEGMDGYQSEIP